VGLSNKETGAFTVYEVQKPGPSVLITTAVKKLGDQLDSRLFTLDVPDDEEHVRQALRTQANIEMAGCPGPTRALIDFQAYLQSLAPWDVVVSFAGELAEELGKNIFSTRIQRDYQRLLSMVKAVTILRHRHRQRDPAGRLVAAIDDYGLVRDLVGDMYQASATEASETVRAAVALHAPVR
jgi:hypothetical protein